VYISRRGGKHFYAPGNMPAFGPVVSKTYLQKYMRSNGKSMAESQRDAGLTARNIIGATVDKSRKALRDPSAAFTALRARLRGQVFTVWCRLFRPRVSIGKRLALQGALIIRGKGRVVIGNNVVVGMKVTPFTYEPGAVIEIGDNVFLNGTRFGCKTSIRIGSRSILAECRISDYDFHSTDPEHRNDPEYIRSSPVNIEENVWVTAGCVILKGATIGRNSTVSCNSVVRGYIPPECIAAGNPATVLKQLNTLNQKRSA
jgi:acetyltransferase-like isoleucine patch superfamily enzyme